MFSSEWSERTDVPLFHHLHCQHVSERYKVESWNADKKKMENTSVSLSWLKSGYKNIQINYYRWL